MKRFTLLKKRGLFLKIGLMVLLLLIIGIGTITMVSIREQTKTIKAELIEKNKSISTHLASSAKNAFWSLNWLFVERQMKEETDSEDIIFLAIIKPNGEAYMSSGDKEYGENLLSAKVILPESQIVKDVTYSKSGETTKLIITPIKIGNEQWSLLMAFSLKQVEDARQAILKTNIGYGSVIFFLGMLLSSLFSRGMYRRINKLMQGIEEIAKGNLDYKISEMGRDELGNLATSFNKMTEDLKKTTTSRDLLAKEMAARKRAEEKTKESEERYRLLFQSSPDSIAQIDKEGRFITVNSAMAESLGIPSKKMIGRRLSEVFPEGVAEQRLEIARKALEEGQTQTFEDEREGRYFHNIIVPIKIPGQEYTFQIISQNITDRVLMHKALHQEKAYTECIVSSIPDMLLVINRKGEIRYVNNALAQFAGAELKEVVGKSLEQVIKEPKLFSPETAAIIMERVKKRLQTSEPVTGVEVKMINSRGEKVPCIYSASGISDPDEERLGEVVIIKDITELKRTEQVLRERTEALERSNRDLEEFAYIASHDLQEPLRMVASYTQLLARRYKGKLDSDADEFIAYAVDGATRMKALINDLLSYSRVGTKGKDFEPTDCEAVFDRTLDNLQKAVEESGAKLTHDSLPTVMADDMQLGQLFQNLIGNAVKFQSEEPPSIHMSCERIEESAIGNRQSAMNKGWVFSVRDNGIGIDPEFTGRIFIIFQRLHKRGEYPGTGIGLAICKKIVERHGGRIWVESQSGKGSTFYFTIPRREEK